MDFLSPSPVSFSKSAYLHYQKYKFWEIRVCLNPNRNLIRCGKLKSDGQEEIFSIEAVEKLYNSKDEALEAAKKYIKAKLSKGYEYLEGKENTLIDPEIKAIIAKNTSLKRKPSEYQGDQVTKQVKKDFISRASMDDAPTQVLQSHDFYEEKPKPRVMSDMTLENAPTQVVQPHEYFFEPKTKKNNTSNLSVDNAPTQVLQTHDLLEENIQPNYTSNLSVEDGPTQVLEPLDLYEPPKPKKKLTPNRSIDNAPTQGLDLLDLLGEETKKPNNSSNISLDTAPTQVVELDIFSEESNSMEVEVRLSKVVFVDKATLFEKARELKIKSFFDGSDVILKGPSNKVEAFRAFVEQLRKKNQKDTQDQVSINLPISPKLATQQKSAIEKKGKDLGLVCQVGKDKVLAFGSEEKIKVLKEYLLAEEKKLNSSGNNSNENKNVRKEEEKKNEDEFVQEEITLPSNSKDKKSAIEQKLIDTGLFYEFGGDTKVYVLGARKTIAVFSSFLKELESKEKKPQPSNDSSQSQEMFIRKEVDRGDIDDDGLEKISKKGESMGIIVTNLRGRIAMLGLIEKINELTAYIEQVKKGNAGTVSKASPGNKTPSTGASIVSKDNSSKMDITSDDFAQTEINISTFHRSKKQEITEKAQEIGLICDFGYDVILVTGPKSSIPQFLTILNDVETAAKKALYPKNWDFHEVRPFSKVELKQNSPEYQEVANLFLNTLDGTATIIKIERIQNKYLMDHYITNIQKKMETRPGQPTNRKLLFHGTRNTEPEVIYKSFDTGFDLQYAAFGSCGQGLYFAETSSYSCNGYEHHTKKRTCQLFLADVFLGKSTNQISKEGRKAPVGYDSVYNKDGQFYVIYNNFHSYPLYLIEYSGYSYDEGDEDYDDDDDEDYDGY